MESKYVNDISIMFHKIVSQRHELNPIRLILYAVYSDLAILCGLPEIVSQSFLIVSQTVCGYSALFLRFYTKKSLFKII